MIELYSSPSVYGQKVHIVLEETGLPYVTRKASEAPASMLNPLGRTPSLFDPQGPDGLPITLGESAAIALYLARKAKKLGPETTRELAEFDYWAFAIAASLSPQYAVAFYLSDHKPEQADWARDTFMENARRMLRLFEERIATRHYLAGERFTILDALLYPHLAASRRLEGDLNGFPNLERYRERIGHREGVKRGMAVLAT